MAKAERLYVAPLGEIYMDALKYEAWLKNRSLSAEANSLLCSALMKREEYRDRMLGEMAAKRGISVDQLKSMILRDEADTVEVPYPSGDE
jgi:hypothetical protein